MVSVYNQQSEPHHYTIIYHMIDALGEMFPSGNINNTRILGFIKLVCMIRFFFFPENGKIKLYQGLNWVLKKSH